MARTSLEHWAVLAAVVDEDGFGQAAEALHKSQSAVSYAVARLQESLGIDLLEVDGRKAVLTAHGKTLLKRARPLIRDLETLERLAQSLKQGSMEASLATVLAGLGYAWLPEHTTSEPIRQGRLRVLPLEMGASRPVSLHLVLVQPETAGPAARVAVEIFQRRRPDTGAP